jgi:hypothetical protein
VSLFHMEPSEQELETLRLDYENEKVFDYDIEDYDNWTAEWYEEEPEGVRCQTCMGTGQDPNFDSDCMVCYGEGFVDGFQF